MPSLRRLPLAGWFVGLAVLAATLAARADDFTWNGGNGTWPSLNWTNVTTSASPVAGPVGASNANTATISAGTVTFAGNDTFGTDGTTATPVITLNAGATLNSGGFYTAIWNLQMAGGTLLADGGVFPSHQAFQLAGTLSVTGTQASTLAVAASPRNALNAISLGGTGNATLTLDVSDVTGDANSDLTISAILKNLGASTVGNLTKTGAGTAVLSAVNTYTGTTNVSGGTLSIASTGGLSSAGSMNVTAGGRLSISGAVTLAANTFFGVGNGIAGTTGTTVIESGANVNLGGNAVLIGGGRPSLGAGAGSLVINGGTVTVAAASGNGGGADNTTVWINPYGNGGASSLSLNGGVFSTARAISDGGAGGSTVNFNGGTLRLLATTTNTVNPASAFILAGGFVLDSNGFDASISRALLTDTVSTGGGLTKQGGGRLTLSGANTFTGATTISGGALRITNAAGLGTTAAGTTVADGAALELSGTIAVGAEPLTLTGGGITSGGALRNVANDNTFGGLITLAAPSRINSDSGTLTLSNTGTITGSGFGLSLGGAGNVSLASNVGTGAGGLVKDGAGTATLSGASTFTGDVTVSGGTLAINRGSNTPTPTATALGNMNVARTVTIQSGATLTNTQHDSLGATASPQPVTFVVDGGTLSHGNQFVTIGAIELQNGGLLTGGNGANPNFQSFNLKGDITVSGTAPASFTTTGTTNTGSHLGKVGGVVFNVADVTGSAATDFTVSAPLVNRTGNDSNAPGSLIKNGAGTMALTVASSYTGGTTITGGVLQAATGGLGPSGTVTMNGGTLRWGAGNTDDLSGRLTLVNSTTATLDTGGNNVSLASSFGASTTAGLAKTGAGTLTLGGTNTFTGATTVSQGTLSVTGAINAASGVTVTSGGTLGGTGTAGATTVATGGSLAPGVAGAGTLTLSSLTFGAAPGDTATVAIGLASNIPASSITVTGDVVANGSAGSVVFPFGTDLAVIPTSTYPLVTYGGTQLADVSAFTVTGTVGPRQGVAIGNGTGVINLVVTNAWPIWKGDAGSGWSTTDNWVLNTTSAPTSFIADDTVFFSDGADTGAVEITQNVNPTITTFNAASLAYSLTSSGGFGITSGSVVKSGAATVTISNANSYTGGTTLSSGRLRVGSNTALGTGVVTFAGGSLSAASGVGQTIANGLVFNASTTLGDATDTGSLTISGTVDLGGTARTLTIASDVSVTGVVSNGGLTKAGPATLTLAAANSYAGATSVSAGTLALTGSGTLGGGTATVALAGGRLDLGGTSQSAGAVTISAAAAAGDTITAGTLTGSSYAISNTTGNVAVAATLAGSAGLTKTGAGTATLAAVNTYTGQTNVSGGTLAISGSLTGTSRLNPFSGGRAVVSGAVTVGDNGVFAVGSSPLTAGDTGEVVVEPGATLTIGNFTAGSGGATYIGGKINNTGNAGTGTFTINGGTVNVAGPGAPNVAGVGDTTALWLNPYGGSGSVINLNGGVLSTARPIVNGSAAAATVNLNGGTLRAAAANLTLLSGGPPFVAQLKNGGLTVDTNGFNATISAPLANGGAGGLTKIGTGSLTLSAANAYVGNTAVSAGTLALAAAGTFDASPVVSLAPGARLDLTSKTTGFSFGASQTLAGSGLVSLGAGRDLTISGSLAPGQSPGTLSVDGNLVLDATSTSVFEIDGVTSGLYDVVQQSGGSRTATFGGTLSLAFASGWSTETTLKLFDFATYSGAFSQVQTTGLGAGYSASFNELTGDVVVVPEPGLSAAAIAVLSAGIGLAARRRRKPA